MLENTKDPSLFYVALARLAQIKVTSDNKARVYTDCHEYLSSVLLKIPTPNA